MTTNRKTAELQLNTGGTAFSLQEPKAPGWGFGTGGIGVSTVKAGVSRPSSSTLFLARSGAAEKVTADWTEKGQRKALDGIVMQGKVAVNVQERQTRQVAQEPSSPARLDLHTHLLLSFETPCGGLEAEAQSRAKVTSGSVADKETTPWISVRLMLCWVYG